MFSMDSSGTFKSQICFSGFAPPDKVAAQDVFAPGGQCMQLRVLPTKPGPKSKSYFSQLAWKSGIRQHQRSGAASLCSLFPSMDLAGNQFLHTAPLINVFCCSKWLNKGVTEKNKQTLPSQREARLDELCVKCASSSSMFQMLFLNTLTSHVQQNKMIASCVSSLDTLLFWIR